MHAILKKNNEVCFVFYVIWMCLKSIFYVPGITISFSVFVLLIKTVSYKVVARLTNGEDCPYSRRENLETKVKLVGDNVLSCF